MAHCLTGPKFKFQSQIEQISTNKLSQFGKSKPTTLPLSIIKNEIENINVNVNENENENALPKSQCEHPVNPLPLANAEPPITLSRCKRFFMFLWILIINLIVNMEHGTIPAVTNEIEQDLNIVESELGLFGSLVYFGNLLGSIISMSIINKINRKILLFVFLILNGVALFAFTATKNIGFLYFDRVMLGCFQSFITIYCPVWVDQFGPRNRKAVMMSVVQIASPVGVVVGYSITSSLKETSKWTFSYIIQAILFGVFSVVLLFIPHNYISTSLHCINLPDPDQVKMKTRKEDTQVVHNTEECKVIEPTQNEDVSLFDHIKEKESKAKFFWKTLCVLIKVKLFMLCVSSLSCLLFISTAIQYWTTNYLTNDLKFDSTVIFVVYVVTSLSAPTAGILLGGLAIQKAGGYETKIALVICSFFGISAVMTGASIPFAHTLPWFTSTLWFFLFFGGCVVPNIFGIIISCVPDEMKASANSVTNFLVTLVGYIPSPYVYGVIYQATKHKAADESADAGNTVVQPNNFAYGFVIYYSFISFILILTAAFVRYRQFNVNVNVNVKQGKQMENDKEKCIPTILNCISRIQNIEVCNFKIELIGCEREIEFAQNIKKSKTCKDAMESYSIKENVNVSAKFNSLSPFKNTPSHTPIEQISYNNQEYQEIKITRLQPRNGEAKNKILKIPKPQSIYKKTKTSLDINVNVVPKENMTRKQT